MADAPDGNDADEKRLAITVDVWKYIVSVQMHFNDIEMRIRNLYFTILAAAIGLFGVVQGKEVGNAGSAYLHRNAGLSGDRAGVYAFLFFRSPLVSSSSARRSGSGYRDRKQIRR